MTPNKAGHPMYDLGLNGPARNGSDKGKVVDVPAAVTWTPSMARSSARQSAFILYRAIDSRGDGPEVVTIGGHGLRGHNTGWRFLRDLSASGPQSNTVGEFEGRKRSGGGLLNGSCGRTRRVTHWALLPKPPKPSNDDEWVRIESRLPAHELPVLVRRIVRWGKSRLIFPSGRFIEDHAGSCSITTVGSCWRVAGSDGPVPHWGILDESLSGPYHCDAVTHWMPIPAPPGASSNEVPGNGMATNYRY